jgi:arginine decarboxylase
MHACSNAVIRYLPGIPVLMSGENFGGPDSPQSGYLRSMENREQRFPVSPVIEGAELVAGSYHVLCVRKWADKLAASEALRVT